MRAEKKRSFQTVVDPKYAEETWKILERAIDDIYKNNDTDLDLAELHRNVYYMVHYKFGENLYSGLVATMTLHLKETAKSVSVEAAEEFLKDLNEKWAKHNKALRMIQDIMMYMDKNFIPSTRKTPVYKLGLNLWRDHIIHSNKIQKRLQDALLELVKKERTNEVIDRGLMRNVIQMLMDLGSSVYQEDFEKPFLEASADFYRLESQQLIQSYDCGYYLKEAEKRLNEELERVSHYLDTRSESKITNIVEKEMIESRMERLVQMENSGLVYMIVNDRYDDLRRMYNVLRRVPAGLELIRDVMISHIRESVTDPERLKDPVDFVQRLLDEKDKHDKIISSAFNNDITFQRALSSSFKDFINLNTRSPEFISLFVDGKLQKGLKGVTEDDFEMVLDKVMMLFRYLEEKYMFQKYYQQHLAKRLLSGKTVSDDAERRLIVKLKTECGKEFTSKLESMFTDMKTSQDTMQGFHSAVGAEISDGPSLTFQVLTTGSWPTKSVATCNLPPEILGVCDKFKTYYLGTHRGRRLSWQTNLGTANLNITFGNGKKHQLKVSTYQMCIMMLFNDADMLSYREIEQATEIPASDLKRCLQSLACVERKSVLRKEPMSKDISEDDAFYFNDEFSSKDYQIDIGTDVVKMESEPDQETKKRLEQERKPAIKAAIVRIMKSRRVLSHNTLIAEVTKQLEPLFLPKPKFIKLQIEDLIEKEFMKRDETDSNSYHYVA